MSLNKSSVFNTPGGLADLNKLPMEEIERLASEGYVFTIKNGEIIKVDKECEKQ